MIERPLYKKVRKQYFSKCYWPMSDIQNSIALLAGMQPMAINKLGVFSHESFHERTNTLHIHVKSSQKYKILSLLQFDISS